MTKRSPVAVFFLSIFTLGIYSMVWFAKTGQEMNNRGARVPHFMLSFLPPFNMIWLWEYSKGVELMSGGTLSATKVLLMQFSLGLFALPVFQSKFNKLAA